MGTAHVQGIHWGSRAKDWAGIQEHTAVPLYRAVLEKTGVCGKSRVLDVGCGAGTFCSLAAALGASVAGIDAAPALIALAEARSTGADLRVGEMEELPFDDQAFDVVTGFNSFQYAASPVNALRQARRVARRRGLVSIAVWGKAEECEAAVCLAALGRLLPPPPPGTPGPFAMSLDRAMERLACEAELQPVESGSVPCPFSYPNMETALLGLLSAGPAVRAIEHVGEEPVREAIADAISPFQTHTGAISLKNSFSFLVARA